MRLANLELVHVAAAPRGLPVYRRHTDVTMPDSTPMPTTHGARHVQREAVTDNHDDGGDGGDGGDQDRRLLHPELGLAWRGRGKGEDEDERGGGRQRCFVPLALTAAVVLGGGLSAACFVLGGCKAPGSSQPPPPPGGTALQLSDSWASRAELEGSPWHDYLLKVYDHDLTVLAFPFSLLQLHMFHTPLLPPNVFKSLHVREQDPNDARIIGRPMVFGELYRLWGGSKPVGVPWDQFNVWRCIYSVGGCEPPTEHGECATDGTRIDYSLNAVRTGLPSHSKVEVTHRVGDRPGSGMWFYWARGSGIYFVRGAPLTCLAATSCGSTCPSVCLLLHAVDWHADHGDVCRICGKRWFTVTTPTLPRSAT